MKITTVWHLLPLCGGLSRVWACLGAGHWGERLDKTYGDVCAGCLLAALMGCVCWWMCPSALILVSAPLVSLLPMPLAFLIPHFISHLILAIIT